MADTEMSRALKAGRGLVVSAVVFGAAVNLLYLAPSLYMMQVYDRVLETGALMSLAFVSGILVFALAVLAVLDSLRSALMARLSLKLDRLLTPRILDAAMSARAGEAKRNQVLRAFDSFRQTITGSAALAVLDAPWTPIYVCVAFLIHPYIGALAIAGGALLLLLAIANERSLRARLVSAGEIAPQSYALQEAEAGIEEAARALGMRGRLIERQLARRATIGQMQLRIQLVSSRYASVTKFVRLVLQSAALGVGAWLAVERQISPGALIAGSILTSRALAPLEQIVAAWRQIGEARNAFNSTCDLLNASPATGPRMALPAPSGAVRLDRVSVLLSDRRAVLNDVSLTIEPGEVLGVIGPSGAGKSTLARVIAGAIAPDAGTVRMDGANYTDWDGDELGRHVGYVPQQVSLAAGTVADNIRRFALYSEAEREAAGAAVSAAAFAARAHDMILRLPKGYDTELGVGGVGLSSGQAQHVALARALYLSPALLVLDEANAHLDQEGDAALLSVIKDAKARGAATVLIAHRAGALSACDKIALMRGGRIEAIGPYNEIMPRLGGASPVRITPLRPAAPVVKEA